MISILPEAKNRYIDATFKVVCKPFTQLFSILAFVKLGEHAKQIPLLFAIMSGKCLPGGTGVGGGGGCCQYCLLLLIESCLLHQSLHSLHGLRRESFQWAWGSVLDVIVIAKTVLHR